MRDYRNGEICCENNNAERIRVKNDEETRAEGVVLGVDGGTTSTVCVCMKLPSSYDLHISEPPPILGRAAGGCSNRNSVGEVAARETLEQVMVEALRKSGCHRSEVQAVCLAVSGVSNQNDKHLLLQWLRKLFAVNVELFVYNDAVAALASGTAGILHGCVLIAGTGSIAYGFTEDGREGKAAGAGPVLGDWGSGYGIASQALTAIIRAHDGRGPATTLTSAILQELQLLSPDELIGWTYADSSWARIAALVPIVKSCAREGDQVAQDVMSKAVEELTSSIRAVVLKLGLCGNNNLKQFPLVMVGGVLETNEGWDIGKEVVDCISKEFPGMTPIRPKVEPAVGAAFLAWNLYSKASSKGPNMDN